MTGKFTPYSLISANIFHIIPDIKPLFTFAMRTSIILSSMESKKKFTPNPNVKLLDQVRETLRYYHYAMSTEKTY